MRLSFYITIIFSLLLIQSFGQVDHSKLRLRVLIQNKIGKEFKFSDSKDSTKLYLKYLGQLSTRKGVTYKIVASIYIWGMSHRATSRIVVFTKGNKYVGNYYITVFNDLPNKVINNRLIFTNSDPNCDKKVMTKLSFVNGIPAHFFQECKKNTGDFCSFSSEE